MNWYIYFWIIWGIGALIGLAITAWIAAGIREGSERTDAGEAGFWLSVAWPLLPAVAVGAGIVIAISWLSETSWQALCRYRAPKPKPLAHPYRAAERDGRES